MPNTADEREDPEEEYNMTKGRRGLALIFNYQQFKFERTLSPRFGSDVDCCKMEERLKSLGFEVKVFKDSRQDEVNEKINEAAKADHSDADCFVLVFMSHGEKNHVYTYDDKLKIKDITDKFNGTECKSLVGKPKIFIWQACRGNEINDPVTPCDATNIGNSEVVEAGAVYTLPAGADFIMCYSVAKGYVSHRDEKKGSWYIQALCELLQKHGDSLEFTHLLTLVNRKVSVRDGRVKTEDGTIKPSKQVPCFASMLTKKLYFRQK